MPLFSIPWSTIGTSSDGLSVVHANIGSIERYSVVSPYLKMPLFYPRTRWYWLKEKEKAPVFHGRQHDKPHVANLSTWFNLEEDLVRLGFIPKVGIFLDYSSPVSDEDHLIERQFDTIRLHNDTRMHHAVWRHS